MQVETEPEPMQMAIFTPLSQRIVDRIEEVDVNALTPLQALNLLEELKQELKAELGLAVSDQQVRHQRASGVSLPGSRTELRVGG